MKQLFSSHSLAVTGTGTGYLNPLSLCQNETTELRAQCPVSAPGTFRNLIVKLTAAPGGAVSIVYTVMLNNVDTTLTVTITGAATTASDTTHSFTVAAGDRIVLKRVISGGTPASADMIVALEFEGSNAKESLYGGACNFCGGSVVQYTNPVSPTPGGWQTGVSQTDQSAALWAVAGTLTRMDLRLETAVGASPKSREFALILNGVVQDGSGGTADTRVTISGAAATTGSATFSLTLAAGDVLTLQDTPTSTPASSYVGVGLAFTATTDGEANFGGSTSNSSGTGTFYNVNPNGGRAWNATEANVDGIAGVTTFNVGHLRIKTSAADNGHTANLRKNAANAGPSAVLGGGGTTAVDNVNTASLASGDTWGVQSTGGAGSVRINYAMVLGDSTVVTGALRLVNSGVIKTRLVGGVLA